VWKGWLAGWVLQSPSVSLMLVCRCSSCVRREEQKGECEQCKDKAFIDLDLDLDLEPRKGCRPGEGGVSA
jgi:hypothetical protein